jgi:hypothetical protein
MGYFCAVKRFLKISAVLGISILYGFLLSLHSGIDYHSNASSKSADLVISTSVDSSNLFCHTEQTESLGSVYSHVSRSSVKNSFNQFTACQVAAGKLIFNKYLPNIYCSRNLVIAFKPTDIIFPFHYFW